MTLKTLLTVTMLIVAPVLVAGQGRGVAPDELLKPLGESWLTYSGDYTGRRYSSLRQINQNTVKNLTLAWLARLNGGVMGGRGGGAGGTQIGGYGSADFAGGGAVTLKGSPLMVDGTLYVSAPDNAWAVDARDGRELWHYYWRTRGGTHIANRGLGIWNDFLYMVTPDDYLVSLEAKTGKERWNKVHADFNQQYFSTTAPIVVGNHVLVGTGNDLDSPGYMQSFDPVTGGIQWRPYLGPMHLGHRGLDRWPSVNAPGH